MPKKTLKEELEIKENQMNESDELGATPKTEETVTLKHKKTGKEIVVTKTVARQYEKIGYAPIKEDTSPPWDASKDDKNKGTVTDKSGAKHTPMSRARHLARLALQQQAKKPVKEEVEQIDESAKPVYTTHVDVKNSKGDVQRAYVHVVPHRREGGPNGYRVHINGFKNTGRSKWAIAHMQWGVGSLESAKAAADRVAQTGKYKDRGKYGVQGTGKEIPIEVPGYAEKTVKEETKQIDEANEYHKIAVKHLKDLHRKDSTPEQKEYARKMNKRALEAAKMEDPVAAKKHYMGVSEEAEHQDVTEDNETFGKKSHQYKTTIKHIKNPTVSQRMAAHDIKPGVAGYRDRIAMFKDAEAQRNLKKEEVELSESKMSELHTTISDHLDTHVNEYKQRGGAEALASHINKTVKHVAKTHGLSDEHARKFVNDYVEHNLKEETQMTTDLDEARHEPSAPDPEAVARKKRLEAALERRQEKEAETTSVRKVAGTAYGGAKQKDEPEEEEGTTAPVKRGRGRPRKIREMIELYNQYGLKSLHEMINEEPTVTVLPPGPAPKGSWGKGLSKPKFAKGEAPRKPNLGDKDYTEWTMRQGERGRYGRKVHPESYEEYDELMEEPDNEQFTKEVEQQKRKASGTAPESEKAKVAAAGVQAVEVQKEDAEFESLIENVELINEVSLGAKIRAYVHHASSSFEHDDYGDDEASEHHGRRAEKIYANILKHHGTEAAHHAEKAADSAIYGTERRRNRRDDTLSGGLRGILSKSVTKAGKVPKGTQTAMKGVAKGTYGKRVTGPKGHLPEEVELDERTLTSDETGKKEHYVKSMKKNLAGFKERYGKRAKEVLYATATKMAKEEVEE